MHRELQYSATAPMGEFEGGCLRERVRLESWGSKEGYECESHEEFLL